VEAVRQHSLHAVSKDGDPTTACIPKTLACAAIAVWTAALVRDGDSPLSIPCNLCYDMSYDGPVAIAVPLELMSSLSGSRGRLLDDTHLALVLTRVARLNQFYQDSMKALIDLKYIIPLTKLLA
jgi:hypothetical protein